VPAALAGPPERTLSRLLCPRRLAPRTAYLACVVPTFAAGRQAGLGEPVTAGTEPAWTAVAGELILPVYHHWQFTTGEGGDFEALVRRLAPRALDPAVGVRELDVSQPGGGVPDVDPPGLRLGLEGALRPPALPPTPWPEPARSDFQRALGALLAAPADDAEPVLGPPLYGAVHAGAGSVEDADAPPAWLRELNLDPRHRAAAAFGVQVVQRHQEQLMASAWQQVGELERANQLLRQSQLGRAVSATVVTKRLAVLPPSALLQVTGSAHGRLATAGTGRQTLLGSVRESVLPEAAVSGALRRALRPRGPLGRRVGDRVEGRRFVGALAAAPVRVPMADVLSGAVELDAVGTPKLRLLFAGVPTAPGWRVVDDFAGIRAPALATAVPAGPDLPGDALETGALRRQRLAGINRRFRAASQALQAYVDRPAAGNGAKASAPVLPVAGIRDELLRAGGALDPGVTVPREALGRLRLPPDAPRAGADALATVAGGIRFP